MFHFFDRANFFQDENTNNQFSAFIVSYHTIMSFHLFQS